MKRESPGETRFELCFLSRFDARLSKVFPCDARGRVDMDQLGRLARTEYLFARAVVGHDFHAPRVRACALPAAARSAAD